MRSSEPAGARAPLLWTGRRQLGFVSLGTLSTILLLVVSLSLAFKLVPLYFEHGILKSIMDRSASDMRTSQGGPREIAQRIARELEINGLEQIDPRAFEIRPVGQGLYEVRIAYERRVPLAFNVDALVRFSHQSGGASQ